MILKTRHLKLKGQLQQWLDLCSRKERIPTKQKTKVTMDFPEEYFNVVEMEKHPVKSTYGKLLWSLKFYHDATKPYTEIEFLPNTEETTTMDVTLYLFTMHNGDTVAADSYSYTQSGDHFHLCRVFGGVFEGVTIGYCEFLYLPRDDVRSIACVPKNTVSFTLPT